MNGHTTSCRKLLVADMALKVLSFLVLHQYLLVVKFPIAVVTPHLGSYPLLLLSHYTLRLFPPLLGLLLLLLTGFVRLSRALSISLAFCLCFGIWVFGGFLAPSVICGLFLFCFPYIYIFIFLTHSKKCFLTN